MKKLGFLPALPLIFFTLVFVLGPLIYMLGLSFMTKAESWGVLAEFTTKNYTDIFKEVYLTTFWESIKMALITTALTLLVGYPFGYFMARLSEKGKKIMLLAVVVPFWTSALVRLYGWIILFQSNGLIDKALMGIGLTEEPLKLLFSYPAVLVGMVYTLLPYMILSVYSSAEKLDFKLVEAARDLGAGRFAAFRSVTLPLTLPGILSGIILVFIPSMGLFFVADILGGGKFMLVGNLIREQLLSARNWPFAAAISVVLMLATILFIWLYHRITHVEELEGLL